MDWKPPQMFATEIMEIIPVPGAAEFLVLKKIHQRLLKIRPIPDFLCQKWVETIRNGRFMA
jgi:hypothetical protein